MILHHPLTIVHAGLLKVPHCGCLDNVSDDKLLNGLVFGNASTGEGSHQRVDFQCKQWVEVDSPRAVGASHVPDVSPSVLGATAVSPFLCLY